MRVGRAAWGVLALVLACWSTSAQAPSTDPHLDIPIGGGPVDVGPIPRGLDAIDARSCGECHRDEYRQWRRSAHRVAFTNPVFTAEYSRRRPPFCARCHAPRDDHTAGVDCATCHVRDGAVIGTAVSGDAPHSSRVAEALPTTLACARCHQFEFEDQSGELLQRTVDEWMLSEHRDETCQDCHMEAGRHDFAGGLDRALLRDAIRVRGAAEIDDTITRVELELSADRAGHAVPTGDIFRRIEVRAWPIGHPERAESTTLARRFRVTGRRWREREDTRIPPRGSRRVVLEVTGRADRVAYRVDLWRTGRRNTERHGWPLSDVRRTLASGTLRARR